MAWFFTDNVISGDSFTITGEDASHIKKSLRMRQGEELTLVSADGYEHQCTIIGFSEEGVEVNILAKTETAQEPDIRVTLYQALTKGDKMDFIVQKAVELGVSEIVPVITNRCISRPDDKSIGKKLVRWQKIALGAAQQSRRGIVPVVSPMLTLNEAGKKACVKSTAIVFYECGGESLNGILEKAGSNISIFIGSEGGFEAEEIDMLKSHGVMSATLGKRILRAETAPLAALSAIMFFTGNMD